MFQKLSRKTALGFFVFFLSSLVIFSLKPAYAAPLLNKSLVTESSLPSVNTTHTISYRINTVNIVGSVVFEYCSNSPLENEPCVPPNGLYVRNSTITSQGGETGFTVSPLSTANKLIISRVPSVTSVGNSFYRVEDIINPDASEKSIFVRISTYASTDGTGSDIDKGSLAFSINPGLAVSGYVPPYLVFCAGVNVALKCTSGSGYLLDLGNLSTIRPSYASSQLSGATNDNTGYSVSVIGTTMTSGNNAISRLSSPTSSSPGSEQFGINLVSNNSPTVGANATGPGTATATSDYSKKNKYKFKTGEVIVSSNVATDYKRFTVSYLVNITSNQAPGDYATTLTYVALANF